MGLARWRGCARGAAAGIVLLVGVAAVAACGAGGDGGAGDVGEPGAAVGSSSESSPFTVGRGPEGYRVVRAGLGGLEQTWSSDSFGDDEPVTVLAPPGAGPGDPGAVWVSLTGFEGFQGGLDQASASYTDGNGEHFELDGREAIYTPAADQDGRGERAELVVVAGDDLAVRVAAHGATRDELVEVARSVEPRGDHLLAPQVVDPPGDLEVLGWADADVAVTLINAPYPGSDVLPAGSRAHSASWVAGASGTPWAQGAGTVTVSTLPGTALDLDALAASLHRYEYQGAPQVVARDVNGRAGAVLERPGTPDWPPFRAVVTSTAGGDLLLVVAHGDPQPPVDELVTVAASVEPATDTDWDAFVEAAGGGPGLRPDDGAVELTRGNAGGVEWLLQARLGDGTGGSWGLVTSDSPRDGWLADPCLVLDTGERRCPTATSMTGGASQVIGAAPATTLDDGRTLPAFIVVMTTTDAAAVRLRPDNGAATAQTPLYPVPGDRHRAAVLFSDHDPGPAPDCANPNPRSSLELVNGAGQPIAC